MALTLFGVTADDVRLHFFPQNEEFSANTSPSATTVGDFIDQEAGRLAGALLIKGVTPSSILSTSPAYYSCAAQLEMMVALRTLSVMSGQNPELARAWKAQVDEWFSRLDKDGYLILGDESLEPTDNPDGPTTHITYFDLDTGDADDASDLIPALRRDDVL
jgi:hypothetical protein